MTSFASDILPILLLALLIVFIFDSETTHVYEFHTHGWLRECTKWDDLNRRFLVSFFEGGLGVVHVKEGEVLEEVPVVNNTGLGKNSSRGIFIDQPRNRVVVAIADVMWEKYSAVAAYDLITWNRLFLTQLSGPDGEEGCAADVSVDPRGNSYITDAKGNKIWKVGANGEFLHTIRNPQLAAKWYYNSVGLKGIVYHPNGYLLVIHTGSGKLFKVDKVKQDEVQLVKVTGGSFFGGGLHLVFGGGLQLLSPTQLVAASNPSELVESTDNWETARVVGKFSGATQRLVTAATVKDGKVYLNHQFCLGLPKREHMLVEAVFSS